MFTPSESVCMNLGVAGSLARSCGEVSPLTKYANGVHLTLWHTASLSLPHS